MQNAIFGDIFARFPPIFAFLRSFFPFLFGRFDFFRTFAIAKHVMNITRAMMTPEITSGIIYANTSETCQRSHYTISGGHPVEITSL